MIGVCLQIVARAIFCFGVLFLICADAIAQDVWLRTNGPYGGNIQAIATNLNGDIFAATADGGFFRSLDNGNTWLESNNGIKSLHGSSLAVAPNGYIFAGTWGGGIFRSIDNGENWEQVNNGLGNGVVQAIVVDSNGTVFAGTYITAKVFRSSDNGDSWVDVSKGLGFDLQTLEMSPNGYLFVGTTAGIWRSEDSGESWQHAHIGLPTYYTYDMAIDTSNTIYLATRAFPDKEGIIYRSDDNGDTWTRLFANTTLAEIFSVNTGEKGFLYVTTGSGGIFRSTDRGESLHRLDSTLTYQRVNVMHFDSDQTFFAGSLGQGVFRSHDLGVNWKQASIGLANSWINALTVNRNDIVFAGTKGSGVVYSKDRGQTWINNTTPGLKIAEIYSLAIDSSDQIYAGGYGQIFRSQDGGQTWEKLNFHMDYPQPIHTLVTGGDGRIFIAMNRELIHRSIDNGVSWEKLNGGASVLAVNSQGILFSGASGASMRRSVDDGDTWQIINSGLPDGTIMGIAIDSHNSIYISMSGGGGRVFKSEDQGDTWQLFKQPLGFDSIGKITAAQNGDIYVAADGIYRFSNFGVRWQKINSGLTNTSVSSIAFDQAGYVFLGTRGSGIFRSIDTLVTNIADSSQADSSCQDCNDLPNIPHSILLLQNYPNPFAKHTVFSFTLPKSESVRLTVFNMLGKKVFSWTSDFLDVGTHQIEWNVQPNSIAEGLYFYRLQVGEEIQTKKLLLLK